MKVLAIPFQKSGPLGKPSAHSAARLRATSNSARSRPEKRSINSASNAEPSAAASANWARIDCHYNCFNGFRASVTVGCVVGAGGLDRE